MKTQAGGFTLVEIMIAVAILGVLVAIASPYYKTYREEVFRKTCMSNMQRIEHAKAQYSMTASNLNKDITWEEIMPYLRNKPTCPLGGTYEGWLITTSISCTKHDWRTDPKLKGFVP